MFAEVFIDKLKQVLLIKSDRAVDALVEVVATACPSSCARGVGLPVGQQGRGAGPRPADRSGHEQADPRRRTHRHEHRRSGKISHVS